MQGMQNLSPYSYFGVMSHDPPMVTIGPCHTRARPNGMKDSEQNILETKSAPSSLLHATANVHCCCQCVPQCQVNPTQNSMQLHITTG